MTAVNRLALWGQSSLTPSLMPPSRVSAAISAMPTIRPTPHDPTSERARITERRQHWITNNLAPVDPLREAFLQSGMSLGEFARRMGYTRTVPNIDQARRALGLRPDHSGRGPRDKPREHVSWDTAHKILDALNLDPVDVDL
jgi:hypothetical protein